MSAGDIVQPSIVRISSNERADTVDVNALARSVRDYSTALTRTTLVTPRNTNGAPVGTILTGFSLTPNPVPSDGKVRVNGELGVALDADGAFIIKPNGSTIDATIPAGGLTYQVYLYAKDDLGPADQRRFLPVTSPFTEYGRGVETTYTAGYGVYVRSGNMASVVREDSVNGRTRALCLLCIATNVAGAVAITGYNAVTAPNGTDITNRLSAVTAPAAAPSTPYVNASWRAFDDKANHALYELGRMKYQDSQTLTPAVANNYGAYTQLAYGGLDLAVRRHGPSVTIGRDSEGTYGEINLDDYASADLALAAAVALLPANGGTIDIKTTSVLTLAGDVTLPADKSIRIVGGSLSPVDGSTSYLDMVTYKFVCASGSASNVTLVLENMLLSSGSASATGTFILLHDRWQLVVRNSTFLLASTYSGASPTRMITWDAATTSTGDVTLLDTYFSYSTNSLSVGGGVIGSSIAAHSGNVTIARCNINTATSAVGTFSHRLIYFADIRDNFYISDNRFVGVGTANGPFSNQGHWCIYLDSTDNTSRVRMRRVIQNNQFLGRTSGSLNPMMAGVYLGDVAAVRIMNNDFSDMVYGIVWATHTTYNADITIANNNFDTCIGNNIDITIGSGTTATGLRVVGNTFRNPLVGGELAVRVFGNAGSGTVASLYVQDNVLVDQTMSFAASIRDGWISGNQFTRSSASTYTAVLNVCTSIAYSATSLRIYKNNFKGCQYPGGNSLATAGVAIMVYASSVRDLEICENHFEDCENVAYTGGGTMNHSIVRVLTNTATGLRVNGNTFWNIALSLSGAGHRTVHAIALGSTSWGTADAGAWDGVEVCGNLCSDILSRIDPIVIYWLSTIINLKVAGNHFEFDGVSSTSTYNAFAIGSAGVYRNVLITGNTFRYTGSGGGAISYNVMVLAGTFHNIGITNNRWSCTSAFGHASGYGLAWGSSWLYGLNVDGNAFMCDGDTTMNTNTKFFVVPPTVNTARPSFPGAASYYGGTNINIYTA